MLLLDIAAICIAFYALRRARRLDALEARLRLLEEQLRTLRGRPGSSPPREPELPPLEVGAPVEPPAGVKVPPVVPPQPFEVEEEDQPELREPLPRRPRAAEPPTPEMPAGFAPQIDWERWLGVRGAAVLGGVVLALAGIFFFRYSIEHGLIPPWLRVIAGTVTGVGCIVASERFLRRQYAGTADAVAGAGVVILYASTWAASVLYHLIGIPAAFVLMVSVTVVCCGLSWRHGSLVVALLGLIGGFATPFMLASGVDNPIGLFAYVFLLDVALLYLAQQRGWPLLALFSLAATTVYQAAWILGSMRSHNVGIGLTILGVSSLLFGVSSRRAADAERREWVTTQAAGLFLPFLFVLYVAATHSLSLQLVPLALLLGVIGGAACWIGAVQERPWLGLSAASATVAAVGVWAATHGPQPHDAWTLALVTVALAAVFHLAVEWQPSLAGQAGPAPAAMVASLGFFWMLIAFAGNSDSIPLWPWLAAWLGLSGLLLRHAAMPQRGWLQVAAAAGLALGLAKISSTTDSVMLWAVMLAIGVGFQAGAFLRRDESVRGWANHAAACFAALSLLGLSRLATAEPGVAPVGEATAILLGLMIALAAARLGRGGWLVAAVLLAAFSAWDWFAQAPATGDTVGVSLAIELGGVLLLAAFPFVVAGRFAGDRWAWPAAALVGPAFFLVLRELFEIRFGSDFIGLLPIGLGVVALAQAWRARDLWDVGSDARGSNLVWFFVVAIGFLTVAIPLQLEKEWITIGWALEGFGVVLLWRRFDVPWLKYFAVSLLVAVTVRLVANPAVLGYYERPAWRIVNWLLYTYMIPAAALLGSARVLGAWEIERARPWEQSWYSRGRPLLAVLAGFAGVIVVFVWINLAIADWFSTGSSLQVSLDRMPARDLAMSISWAVYALVLLAAGVRLRSVGVRWVSLGLMIVTIAKVFLYDLGELRDLYRVASLLGLAISLIAVSLAYQRFVLARSATEEP